MPSKRVPDDQGSSLDLYQHPGHLLAAREPGAQRLRDRMLAPLSAREQDVFMHLLAKLVDGNNEQSRAPLARPLPSGDT